MEIQIVNKKALESILNEDGAKVAGNANGMLACDGCSCDTGSDWVNSICGQPEWRAGWSKSTC